MCLIKNESPTTIDEYINTYSIYLCVGKEKNFVKSPIWNWTYKVRMEVKESMDSCGLNVNSASTSNISFVGTKISTS